VVQFLRLVNRLSSGGAYDMVRLRIPLVAAALSLIAAGCVNKSEPMSPWFECVVSCTNQCMVDGDCNLAAGMTQAQVDACERSCEKGCEDTTCKGECKSGCPEPAPEDTAGADAADDGRGGDDVRGDAAAGPAAVGGACETDGGCAGSLQCFTREFLEETAAGFGVTWEYDIPGGMCSLLMCQFSPDLCGDGGFCFDVAPLFGEESTEIGLCLKHCADSFDCRWQEGYLCYYTGVEGERACLPAGLIAEIPCGDGVCGGEAARTETAETCPRDCGERGEE